MPSTEGHRNNMEQTQTLKQKYKIGQGGDIDEIPSDEEGVCDCQRYCGGGKVVRAATFRRHNPQSENDATPTPSTEGQNKRRKRVEMTVEGKVETNHLVNKLAGMPVPSVTELMDWFEKENIWIHKSLEIKAMADLSGLGIFAVNVGVPQQVVCKIPRSAILSSRTTTFANSLPKSTRSQIPPIALLSLSLLYEFRLGRKSRYWGYLQSLPRRHVEIAPLWSVSPITGEDGQSAAEKVKGTDVEAELRRIKKDGHGLQDLRLYHQATKDAFPLTEFSPLPPSYLDVLYVYSLVSSRAFQVDVYHGAALVPLADIFNHQELNNVCFESDDFVCEICGSLPTCEHDEIEGTEPRHADEQGGHGTPEMITIADRLSHLPLEVIRSLFDPSQNTLDLTVKTPYKPGQEVFNTYGEGMSWAKQACEWGFIDESIEGEGVLGRGLKWEVGDIMDRDKDNHEKIKKAWKSQCKTWTDLDLVPTNGSVEVGVEGTQGDSLFFTPGEGAPAKDALLINDDAQVAYPLLWGVASEMELAFTKHEMLAIPQVLNAAAQRLQNHHGDAGEVSDIRTKQVLGGSTKKKLRKLSEGMLRLFQNRLARTWLADTSTSVLCDQLDTLSDVCHGLERMSLEILVAERTVLEVAITVWQDLLEHF